MKLDVVITSVFPPSSPLSMASCNVLLVPSMYTALVVVTGMISFIFFYFKVYDLNIFVVK